MLCLAYAIALAYEQLVFEAENRRLKITRVRFKSFAQPSIRPGPIRHKQYSIPITLMKACSTHKRLILWTRHNIWHVTSDAMLDHIVVLVYTSTQCLSRCMQYTWGMFWHVALDTNTSDCCVANMCVNLYTCSACKRIGGGNICIYVPPTPLTQMWYSMLYSYTVCTSV
jgi:hypothetical protein